ncbi:MAG: NFACT RNA binding domain-containing protein [Spirochaetaceae bacterium]
MSLNWKEIDAILSELDLVDAFIAKIVQPDFHNLYFLINERGTRYWLRFCLTPGATRLHATDGKPQKPAKNQRFAQLLRSRILGGKIREVSQIGTERIIRFSVQSGGEETLLFVRLWSNAANILATDSGGTILDSFYRRPKRGEITGRRFELPESRETGDKTFEVRPHQGAESFNRFVAEQYGEAEQSGRREQLVLDLLKEIRRERQKVHRALEGVEKRRGELGGTEQLKEYADSIMASPHLIEARDGWLVVPDIYHPGETITLEAHGDRSPIEVAGHLYDRYKEQKQKAVELQEDLTRLRHRLEELEEEEAWIPDADIEELQERSSIHRRQSEESGPLAPGIRLESGGFTVLVGRSSQESDQLLRRHVRGNDYWLHVRDHAGGHVFIKGKKNKSVPLDVLLDAGNLALYFSKARSGGNSDVYYTQVKYLRRGKHGKTGTVLPTQEKNLRIEMDPERLDRLLGRIT